MRHIFLILFGLGIFGAIVLGAELADRTPWGWVLLLIGVILLYLFLGEANRR